MASNWTVVEEEGSPLSDLAYTVTGIYLTILGIVSFLGNTFVLIVLAVGKPNFHRIHTVLLSLIATSDLFLSCIAYPFTAIAGYSKRWVFGDVMCTACGFVVYFLMMTTIGALCVLAVTRYIIVCKPKYEYLLCKGNIKWMLLTIFLYALFWTGPPLVGWSSYVQEPFKTSCTVNWTGKSAADISYNTLCTVFCYFFPVAIFFFSYYNVVKTTSVSNRVDRDQDTFNNPAFTVERGTRLAMELTLQRLARNQRLRSTRHMTLVCIAMVTAFLITWTPYAVLTVWNIAVGPSSPATSVLPTMFAKLSCAINPFIYSIVCERFREAAKSLIRCPDNQVAPLGPDQDSGQHQHSPRSDNNLSLCMRKPAIWVSDKVRHKSGCTATKAD